VCRHDAVVALCTWSPAWWMLRSALHTDSATPPPPPCLPPLQCMWPLMGPALQWGMLDWLLQGSRPQPGAGHSRGPPVSPDDATALDTYKQTLTRHPAWPSTHLLTLLPAPPPYGQRDGLTYAKVGCGPAMSHVFGCTAEWLFEWLIRVDCMLWAACLHAPGPVPPGQLQAPCSS
jgi:hypothetical protein